jgi:hypothetical protein
VSRARIADLPTEHPLGKQQPNLAVSFLVTAPARRHSAPPMWRAGVRGQLGQEAAGRAQVIQPWIIPGMEAVDRFFHRDQGGDDGVTGTVAGTDGMR